MSTQKYPHRRKGAQPPEQRKPESFPIFKRTVVAIDDNLHTNINMAAENAGFLTDTRKRRLAYAFIAGGYAASSAVYANSPKQLAIKLVTSGIITAIAVYAVSMLSKAKEVMERGADKGVEGARGVSEMVRLGISMFAGYNFFHFVAAQDAISAAQGIMAAALTFALYLVTPRNSDVEKQDKK